MQGFFRYVQAERAIGIEIIEVIIVQWIAVAPVGAEEGGSPGSRPGAKWDSAFKLQSASTHPCFGGLNMELLQAL